NQCPISDCDTQPLTSTFTSPMVNYQHFFVQQQQAQSFSTIDASLKASTVESSTSGNVLYSIPPHLLEDISYDFGFESGYHTRSSTSTIEFNDGVEDSMAMQIESSSPSLNSMVEVELLV